MVLRAKRAKNGRMMYFKDNKLISKDKFMAARKRASGSKTARKRRSTARKSKSNGVRRMRKSLPHPSVTGMASGLAIAAYLNAGKATQTGMSGVGTVTGDGVVKDITDGQLGKAFDT